jgi:hypothetical protein
MYVLLVYTDLRTTLVPAPTKLRYILYSLSEIMVVCVTYP